MGRCVIPCDLERAQRIGRAMRKLAQYHATVTVTDAATARKLSEQCIGVAELFERAEAVDDGQLALVDMGTGEVHGSGAFTTGGSG